MSTTQPIRSQKDLEKMKHFYAGPKLLDKRNRLLIVMGLNTALRITDILGLKWKSVCDFERSQIKSHIELTEKKTGKQNLIAINNILAQTLEDWKNSANPGPESYLFESARGNHPIDRHQAYRIIRQAAIACGIPGHISCHSLRKTFGYHAWKLGVPPAVLMNIYNHSSFFVTTRYLCIDQDDKDDVFRQIQL